MQKTSELYKELLAGFLAGDAGIRYETRLAVGETGVLITERGEGILIGGVRILVASSGADGGYGDDLLIGVKTTRQMFADDIPSVGGCVAGQIDIEMIKPSGEIPRQARLVPYVRLTDGVRHSEWVQKGVYYVDTRRKQEDGSGIEKIILQGFDDMLRTEQDYPSSTLKWPAKDIDVVREIAEYIDVNLDSRTVEIMIHGYLVQYPAGYSCREVLGYIAAMYGGSFVMSDLGELRLVTLCGIPKETRYLVTEGGHRITIGGVRILV